MPPGATRAMLKHAFQLHAEGRLLTKPKLGLEVGPGHTFQSMCALSAAFGYAATKWVAVAAANAERGLPNVNALVIVSDLETGVPAAILDGNSLTVLRTAAMSALAAAYLARPDSRSIGFVGAGAQALGHLDALRDVLPDLAECLCLSRTPASAEALAAAAAAAGIPARVTADPAEIVACDVVVTTVPAVAGFAPFLDTAALRPGSFVAAVDLGRSWRPEGMGALDLLYVDDAKLAAEPSTKARLAWQEAFAGDLAGLAGGAAPGRTSESERVMFLFPGVALADLAAAVAILREAEAQGRGTLLPA